MSAPPSAASEPRTTVPIGDEVPPDVSTYDGIDAALAANPIAVQEAHQPAIHIHDLRDEMVVDGLAAGPRAEAVGDIADHRNRQRDAAAGQNHGKRQNRQRARRAPLQQINIIH